MTIQLLASSTVKQRPTANGWEDGCRQKPSGRKPRGEQMEGSTCGETNGIWTGAIRKMAGRTDPRAWAAFQVVSVPMASWTWRGAVGSGPLIGTQPSTQRSPNWTRRGRQAALRAWCAAVPGLAVHLICGPRTATKLSKTGAMFITESVACKRHRAKWL